MNLKKYRQATPDRFLAAAVCILMLTLTVGCTAKYGNYNRDTEIYDAFVNNRVPPEYRYYYYHSGSHPIAVIGVEKKYDASSRMWREVEPNTEEFSELVKWTWEDVDWYRYAARINDPSGRQVGIMYTSVRTVAIKFTDDNRIVVMPHTPFLWEVEYEQTERYYGGTESNAWSSIDRLASNP